MRPVLLSKAVMRTRLSAIKPFRYDSRQSINVLNDNPRVAFIDAGVSLGKKDIRELYTKTEESREKDDEEEDDSYFYQ